MLSNNGKHGVDARPGAFFVAAAFECQLFETVPMEARDVRVHAIATERALHRVAGRLPVR